MQNAVQAARTRKGLTQQQLADMADLARQSIISIEKGRFLPTIENALRIAAALNMPVHRALLAQQGWFQVKRQFLPYYASRAALSLALACLVLGFTWKALAMAAFFFGLFVLYLHSGLVPGRSEPAVTSPCAGMSAGVRSKGRR